MRLSDDSRGAPLSRKRWSNTFDLIGDTSPRSLPLFPISRNGIKPQLEAALFERGWEVVAKSQVEDNLWWDELWTLDSRWSPAGRHVYLAFEFDDVTESVAAATRRPIDHHDTDWRTRLDLDKNWSSEFDRFLAEIDELRQDNEDS